MRRRTEVGIGRWVSALQALQGWPFAMCCPAVKSTVLTGIELGI